MKCLLIMYVAELAITKHDTSHKSLGVKPEKNPNMPSVFHISFTDCQIEPLNKTLALTMMESEMIFAYL